jgi:hypothetical protein
MSFWRKPFSGQQGVHGSENVTPDSISQISDGSLNYVGNKGGNDAKPTYQEASGAPVETDSPMGYSVSAFTIMFLNINMMIGTGIFSTRKWPIEFTCWEIPSVLTNQSYSFGYSVRHWLCWVELHLLDSVNISWQPLTYLFETQEIALTSVTWLHNLSRYWIRISRIYCVLP